MNKLTIRKSSGQCVSPVRTAKSLSSALLCSSWYLRMPTETLVDERDSRVGCEAVGTLVSEQAVRQVVKRS